MTNLRLLLTSLSLSLCLPACDWLPDGFPNPGPFPKPKGKGELPEPPPLTWTACEIQGLDGFECSTLEVPLDYKDPRGEKIQLAISRVAHSDEDYRGVMLTNPGGPGESGRFMAYLGWQLPGRLGTKYDWIGIDPRGTGASSPALDCTHVQDSQVDRLPYEPANQGQIEAWQAHSRKIATQCAQGPAAKLLPHLNTSNMARDMDQLRRALRVEKINFWGTSYGTYLGQMYATLFPKRVEKMVWDSVVEPDESWYQRNQSQNAAYPKTMRKMSAWFAQYDAFYNLGDTPESVLQGIHTKLEELRALEPSPSGETHPARLMVNAIYPSMYSPRQWDNLGRALDLYLNEDDPSGLQAIAPLSDSKTDSVYLAITCGEGRWKSWMQTLEDAKQMSPLSPTLTWANTWYTAPCVDWPVAGNSEPVISAEQVDFPILLLAESHDSSTPFPGALSVRDIFPTAILVEGEGGTSHADALSGSDCTRESIFNFLENGALPPRKPGDEADKKCDSLQSEELDE